MLRISVLNSSALSGCLSVFLDILSCLFVCSFILYVKTTCQDTLFVFYMYSSSESVSLSLSICCDARISSDWLAIYIVYQVFKSLIAGDMVLQVLHRDMTVGQGN